MYEITAPMTIGEGRAALLELIAEVGADAPVLVQAHDDLGGERPPRTHASFVSKMAAGLGKLPEAEIWRIGDRDDSGFSSPVVAVEVVTKRKRKAVVLVYDPALGEG